MGLLFAAVVFPIHAWAILQTLQEVPAWILRLDSWDLTGVLAYTQLYALAESITVLLLLVVAALLLPGRLLRRHLVAQGSMIVFSTAGLAIALHLGEKLVRPDRLRLLLLGVVGIAWLAAMGVALFLVPRRPAWIAALEGLARRLAVLSTLYVALGLLGLGVVVLRNL